MATDTRTVPCPCTSCGARAGEPCRTSTGVERVEDHGLRWLYLFTGPLVRCPDGPCTACRHTAWVPAMVPLSEVLGIEPGLRSTLADRQGAPNHSMQSRRHPRIFVWHSSPEESGNWQRLSPSSSVEQPPS